MKTDFQLDVLGTKYTIRIVSNEEESFFEKNNADGYCDEVAKEIVLLDLKTSSRWAGELEENMILAMKATLRHEITHAFFNESGLSDMTIHFEGPWARNEELIDWIALQGPKLYAAWGLADAL